MILEPMLRLNKAFCIFDRFADPPILLFGKLKKMTISVFTPILQYFILIIDWSIKNNKKQYIYTSKHNFSRAARGQHIKTDICGITTVNQQTFAC